MSLGAKLLVGALVLGAAGTAGTYALTNGGFGIGGNGEGSSENIQTASNQNTSAPQAGASPSSDATEERGGGETGRAAPETSLNSQQPSNPAPRSDGQGVSGDVSQEQVQNTDSVNTRNQKQTLDGTDSSVVSGEKGSQLQSTPGVTPPVTVTDQSTTVKASLSQTPEEGETDSQKTLAQDASGDNLQSKDQENTSLPVTKPEAGQLAGTEDPQSPSRPNSAGEGQNQETAPLQSTDPNT